MHSGFIIKQSRIDTHCIKFFVYRYTATELKYLPLNTVLYGPVKRLQEVSNGLEAQSDAESASSSSDDSSSDDDSS